MQIYHWKIHQILSMCLRTLSGYRNLIYTIWGLACTDIRIMENALRNLKFASMIPKGYDRDIDRKMSGEIGSRFIESSYSDYHISDIVQSDRQFYDADEEDRDRYPLIGEQLYVEFCGECAVIGKPHFSGGSISVYEGTNVRYIAFEKVGIRNLKMLYECTTGYEFRKSIGYCSIS